MVSFPLKDTKQKSTIKHLQKELRWRQDSNMSLSNRRRCGSWSGPKGTRWCERLPSCRSQGGRGSNPWWPRPTGTKWYDWSGPISATPTGSCCGASPTTRTRGSSVGHTNQQSEPSSHTPTHSGVDWQVKWRSSSWPTFWTSRLSHSSRDHTHFTVCAPPSTYQGPAVYSADWSNTGEGGGGGVHVDRTWPQKQHGGRYRLCVFLLAGPLWSCTTSSSWWTPSSSGWTRRIRWSPTRSGCSWLSTCWRSSWSSTCSSPERSSPDTTSGTGEDPMFLTSSRANRRRRIWKNLTSNSEFWLFNSAPEFDWTMMVQSQSQSEGRWSCWVHLCPGPWTVEWMV